MSNNNNVFQKSRAHVRNNPTVIKHFIFFEATTQAPIFGSWKKLCNMYGDDVMDYPQFEFWFMRFSRGEFDMDYDWSQEPKHPGLLDMPLDIIDMIGKYLHLMERPCLRNVNKFFHSFVDGWDPEFRFVSIVFQERFTELWFDDYRVTYRDGSFFDISNRYTPSCNISFMGKNKSLIYYHHIDMAFRDLVLILKNPRLNMTKFYVEINSRDFNEDMIDDRFKQMNCPIKASAVQIVTSRNRGEMAVLPYLESGTLREVHLEFKDIYGLNYGADYSSERKTEHINRLGAIGLLEQCQLARIVKFRLHQGTPPGWFPLESFSGCSNVSIEFNDYEKVAIVDILRFKKVLLNPTNSLTYFHFRANHEFTIATLRRRLDGKSTIEVPNEPDVRRFKVPKTNKTLELDFRDNFQSAMNMVMVTKVIDS